MKYARNIFVLISMPLIMMLTGCPPQQPADQPPVLPPSSPGGFAVSVQKQMMSAAWEPDGDPIPLPGVQVYGIFNGLYLNIETYGDVDTYSGYGGNNNNSYPSICNVPTEYNNTNYYWVCNGEAPALWTHTFILNFYCGNDNLISASGDGYYTYQYRQQGANSMDYTPLRRGIADICYMPDNTANAIPQASTRFAILGQLPQTLTLTGEAPYNTTYRMPILYVFNGNATIVGTETATSVSSDKRFQTQCRLSGYAGLQYTFDRAFTGNKLGQIQSSADSNWIARYARLSGCDFAEAARQAQRPVRAIASA
jgi:hypothetical protein